FLNYKIRSRLVGNCVFHQLLRCFQRVQPRKSNHPGHLIQAFDHFHHQKLFHFCHLYCLNSFATKAAWRGRLPLICVDGLFLVFHVYVLCINHAFIFLLFLLRSTIPRSARLRTSARSTLRWLGRFIHGLGQLVRSLGQPLARRVHRRHIRAFQRLLGIRQRRFHIALVIAGDLVAVLFQHLFDVVDQAVKLVASFDLLAFLFILGRMRLGFLGHALHFLFTQTGRRRDGDLLVFARPAVFGCYVQNAVSIDIERDLNLRHSTWSRRNSSQVEFTQRPVVACHWPLALQNVYFHRRLAVCCCREHLGLASGYRGVARNHRRCYPAKGLNRQRQRSHIKQKKVFHIARQHPSLNGGADSYHLIWVHALVRLFSEQLFYQRLNPRHAGLSADQHYFVNVGRLNAGIFHCLAARANRALNNVFHHLLKLCPRELLHQVLWTSRIRSDKRQVDLGLHGRRKLDLCFFGRITKTL